MKNYVPYHMHSEKSVLDSATKSDKYIEKAKELGMKAIAFTEHGSVFNWISKKQYCDKNNIKYIHAQEFYITESIETKVRDNYHTILIAKNWDGVKELNKLSSTGYKRDGHFYYDARITIDELCSTSDNIIVCTACLASPLYKGRESNIFQKYLNFIIKNKHRVYLEIQYHNVDEQIKYNQFLYELHKHYDIPLIVGTDTHAIDKEYLFARKIIQQAKDIKFANEDSFDLSFKSYDGLVEMFRTQNSLPMNIVLDAIENTNVMSDRIEEFELDKSIKYPKLFDNPEKVFQEKIKQGIEFRGINKLTDKEKKVYFDRIKREYDTYKTVGAIDYILLMEDIISFARSNDIMPGYGRGSVNGSIIAYLLGITDTDSIKFNLVFERFCNPERVSLMDIDVDWPPSKRDIIKDYIFNMDSVHCSEIITFNTNALKGSVRDAGRALKMPLEVIDIIAKNVDENEQEYRNQYPELFKYVDLINGVNISVGSHPAGVLVTEYSIDEYIGTFTTKDSKHPICQCNMKEVDSLNYVKLDVLGLDNIEIINETCKIVGIDRINADIIDLDDDNVWNDIKNESLGIFQFESGFAHDTLSKVIDKYPLIRKQNPNVKRIDLISLVNGAIRPSGESIRDNLTKGIFNDNGHTALNKFLTDTMYYLVYQEQIIMFLVKFCGFSMGEADLVRRKIGKKLGTDDVIPEIKRRFIETMHKEYGLTENELEHIIEPFLQIILDSSSYGFSVNHAMPYGFTGYACGWLRHYYPLEFVTTLLNVRGDKQEKIPEIINYANKHNMQIKSIKFRKSKSGYNFDKTTNSIYQGISSIKYLNSKIADELFLLKDINYNLFNDILIDIETKTSIDSRQLEILIKLNFFDMFGKNKKLLNAYNMFKTLYNKKTLKKDKVSEIGISEEVIKKYSKETDKTYKDLDWLSILNEYEQSLVDEKLSVQEQLKAELEYLGYLDSKFEEYSAHYLYITDVNTKYTPRITAYVVKNGNVVNFKVKKALFFKEIYDEVTQTVSTPYELKKGDFIKVIDAKKENKRKKIDDKWVVTDEKEVVVHSYVINRKK